MFSAILIFCFWETAVTLASVRAARLLGKCDRELPLLAVSCNIVICSLTASALSFARINSRAAYAAAAAALLAYGGRELRPRFSAMRYPAVFAALGILALPLAFVALRPVEEIDSLNFLHFLLEWLANRATPYYFSNNYVPFWELGFLPSLVLTRTDLFFWAAALKSLLALCGALWLVGCELALPPRLLIWVTAGAVAFPYHWAAPSGLGTLKNDTLHAAGTVLLVLILLRAARPRWSRADIALLVLGLLFASTKYSGAILGGLALGALAVLHPRRPRFAAVALGAVFLMAASGQYYLRNCLLHGNPFYPYELHFAGLRLPGTADLSGTSILASLGDPRLWRAFLAPAGGISPAGLLFPVVLPATLITCLIRAVRLRERLAFALLAGWFLYFRAIYSASAYPGDLRFVLEGLSSLRYAEGILALSEMYLVWLLVRRGVRETWILALAGMNLASRLWILYPKAVEPPWIALGFCALALAGIGAARSARLCAAAACALAAAGPFIVERNRAHWLPWWKPVYAPFWTMPEGASAYLVEDSELTGYFAGQYPLAGARLQNDVRSGPADGLAGLGFEPRYVVEMLGEPKGTQGLDALSARLAGHYVPVLRSPMGMVLERYTRTRAHEISPAWYAPSGMPREVDEGNAKPSLRPVRNGDIVCTPERIQRLGPGGREWIEPDEGARLEIRNAGTPDASGRASGLVYRYSGGFWQPDLAGVRRHDVVAEEQWEVTVGQGAHRLERLRDEAGPYLRFHAEADTQWMFLVGRLPKDLPDGAPVTVRSQVRCPAGAVCKTVLIQQDPKRGRVDLEHAGEPAGAWETHALLGRIRHRTDGDYYAVGRQNLKRGDWFDVREAGLLEGFIPPVQPAPPPAPGRPAL